MCETRTGCHVWFFWRQRHGGLNRRSFISDEESKRQKNEARQTVREEIASMMCPKVYCSRWSFRRKDDENAMGGIPIEELEGSAVKEPVTGCLWLLHKKMFTQSWDPVQGDWAADPDQQVAVCRLCKESLTRRNPTMPKFALANDLWMGRLPPALHNLSEAAWMLLPLARPLLQQKNCFPDGCSHADPIDAH